MGVGVGMSWTLCLTFCQQPCLAPGKVPGTKLSPCHCLLCPVNGAGDEEQKFQKLSITSYEECVVVFITRKNSAWNSVFFLSIQLLCLITLKKKLLMR